MSRRSEPPAPEFRLGIVGYPLEHSLSPALHAAALAALGLRGEYHCYPVRPLPEGKRELEVLLQACRGGELQGFNVTIPHKQAVISYLDELTPEAWAIGAVNTLFKDGGRLVGDNTDGPGFLADLLRLMKPENGQSNSRLGPALVLGAGGAARAVVWALLGQGRQVFVAARKQPQAQASCDALNRQNLGGVAVPLELELLSLAPVDPLALIVNTTPVGMWPAVDASPWPITVPFPPGALVYDLVYNPAETLFVRQARAAGLSAATGLGMLIEQAALSFERWTGRCAPREVMLKAAVERLFTTDEHG